MLLKFAKDGHVPPGGLFFYTDPANNVPLLQDARGIDSLLEKVREAYRRTCKVPPPNLREIIEHFICLHVPRGFCIGEYPERPPDFMSPQAVKGRTREAADGFGRADPGTAKARMAVCGTCRANNKRLCLSCTGMTDWAVNLAGRTKIGLDDSVGVCNFDRILLSLSVSLRMPNVKPDGRPENCWRLDEPRNDS